MSKNSSKAIFYPLKFFILIGFYRGKYSRGIRKKY